MPDTTPKTHASLVQFWQEVIATLVGEGANLDAVTSAMLEVAIAGRMTLIGPARLSAGLREASESAQRLAASSTDRAPRVH